MATAILSALPEEQEGLAALMTDTETVRHAGREFHRGRWQGAPVVFALSRIGKVAAATTAAALIERFGVQRIVFTGVAGGLHPEVRVGDTVIAGEFLQHDMDATPLFPRHEIPLYARSRFGADMALSATIFEAATADKTGVGGTFDAETIRRFGLQAMRVHRGLLVSGDRFVSSAGEARALREALPDALAVDMEGAAVAQVCHDYGIPFAAVRHISDRADDAAHVDFPAYLKAVAALQARAVITRFLSAQAQRP
ncbi:5'-methylthioadenosine/S-adenosylhomocysteine nucleosidase [Rhodoferax koreense]|uniref:adenosylhomocysteine nucleosidase n=1 Tax=Rhodoferax koreensis TaxID=1842727 RepID=A0A1P8K283_9BURK|nr:5'-methylthioadenosine/adenosylhomocysteine nucleosidase [Rhodoferax koreense]APW40096.1 5'-methylthioadenosine/S-adenosylhomocysteine nucleosidase [Rhodoferax koreense]